MECPGKLVTDGYFPQNNLIGINLELLGGSNHCFFITQHNFDLHISAEGDGGMMSSEDDTGSLDPENKYTG